MQVRVQPAVVVSALWLVASLAPPPASALPSFADQTGLACSACHAGGFGPQLTQTGRDFKIAGYTARANAKAIPLAAMAVGSTTHTAKAQDEAPTDNSRTNNNTALDELSLFLAGGLGQHLGGFVQGTYSGAEHHTAWDNVDLRAVSSAFHLGASDLRLGFDLNNSPTVQDPWNTLPGWSFPFTQSDLAPAPGTSPLIADGLAQAVTGASTYAWINSSMYAEFGLYRQNSDSFLHSMGVDTDGTNILRGSAPYWRLAYQGSNGGNTFHVGVFGLSASLYPDGDRTTGQSDRYRDLGFDASMQRSMNGNIFSLNGRVVRETQNLAASETLGNATTASGRLTEFAGSGSYFWRSTYGGTIGLFRTTGSGDALRFADNRTNKPDSSGYTLELDWTPFADGGRSFSPYLNLRVGLQYTGYTRFDGARTDYDGNGRSASDNNTTRLYTWLAF